MQKSYLQIALVFSYFDGVGIVFILVIYLDLRILFPIHCCRIVVMSWVC